MSELDPEDLLDQVADEDGCDSTGEVLAEEDWEFLDEDHGNVYDA